MNRFLISLLIISVIVEKSAIAQLKQLDRQDYDKWERPVGGTISNNGEWVVYTIRNNADDNVTYIKSIDNTSEISFKYASSPKISDNSKWVAIKNGVAGSKAKELKKTKKPIPAKITLYGLYTRDTIVYDGVEKFEFSGTGNLIALQYEKGKDKKAKGKDLVIKNLETSQQWMFGNTTSFAWQQGENLIAIIVNGEDKAQNLVQVLNPETSKLTTLDAGDMDYDNLKWRKDSKDLLVSREVKKDNFLDNSFDILVWKDLFGKNLTNYVLSSSDRLTDERRVINPNQIRWADDGTYLLFSVHDWLMKKEENETEKDTTENKSKKAIEESADVEIWHSKDEVLITQQKKRKEKSDKQVSWFAWHLQSNILAQLTDDLVESVRLQTDVPVLIGYDRTPYEFDGMFGRPNADLYAINVFDGSKQKLIEKASRSFDVDPTGKYVIVAKENKLAQINLDSREVITIASDEEDSFFNIEDDHPVQDFWPYGFAGWSEGGKAYYINSKYNIWRFKLDGKGMDITQGASTKTVYRYRNYDRDRKYINDKKPLLLSTFGELTKNRGYAEVISGKEVKSLIYDNARVDISGVSNESNNILFIRQSYTTSPDYYVTTDNFSTETKLSSTNEFQKDYLWSKAELITYKNDQSEDLQGILYYPAGYEEGKKYPMITYIYEKLSSRYHNYSRPSKTNYYNTTVFTTQGYFVLQPDIIFEPGNPGVSSTKTIEAAVKKVVGMGIIDPKHIGLIGHSWGGYQAAYVPTQTDIFAASVAGAGLTDLISMYGAITPGFGGSAENGHFEVGQERMIMPPWKDTEGYVRNSPVLNIEKLNTPMLFEVGDADMNVNRRQGVEYYNAARRVGKQFVLLMYAKEGHGLRQAKNQEDYQKRILAWFGHYLKGEEAEDWILDGIPYSEQQRRLGKDKK